MNETLPYMPVFTKDLVAEAAGLDALHRGALWSLMFACWSEGGWIDSDPDVLACTARVDAKQWPRVWSRIGRFFDLDGARLHHPHVTALLAEALAKSANRKAIARLGGAAKAAKARLADSSADSTPIATGQHEDGKAISVPTVCHPSPSSAPAEKGGADAPRARDPGPGASSPSTTARPAYVPPPEENVDPLRPIETAHDLEWRYRVFWERRHKAMWPGEPGISVLCREIMERLFDQGPERFARAAALLPRCLELYLGDQKVAGHRHPFKWFAERLAALMADAETGTTPANRTKEPSLFCDFHRGGANNLVRSPAPVKTCPECRHLGSRARPRPASEPTGFTAPEDPRGTWPTKAAGGSS